MADLDVYVHRRITGRLAAGQDTTDRSKHIFTYALQAQEAVSLTMPLRTMSYAYSGLHPVFQMNLPEGALKQALCRAVAKQYGSDDLRLLAILGANQIGRTGYALVDQALASYDDAWPNLDALLSSQDVTLFEQLLNRYAHRSGVAGVQPKVLVDIQQKASLPMQRLIVKSWGPEFPQLACNEFFCLSVAKQAGLTLPNFYLSNNARLLITQRFDLNASGEPIGFEDFCVLQGKTTAQKYDASLESCTVTIRAYVSPQQQSQALFDFFVLSLLNVRLRNGDAHLKNLGVLYNALSGYESGKMLAVERRMAPIFDIVSTVPYLPNDTMALTLTGSKRWPKWKVLKKFAQQHCLLNPHRIEQAVEAVSTAINVTQPLLGELVRQCSGFQPIAESMQACLTTSDW